MLPNATSRDPTQAAGPPGSRLSPGKTAGFSFVPGAGIISDLKGRRCVLGHAVQTPHALASNSSLLHSDGLDCLDHRIPQSGMRIVWHPNNPNNLQHGRVARPGASRRVPLVGARVGACARGRVSQRAFRCAF
jgi:hypothetical protein